MNRKNTIGIAASNFAQIGCIIAMAFTCSGCTLIPLATVGAVFDIAGSTVSAGPAIFHQGKLDTAFMADSPDVQEAVRSASADLYLRVVCEHKVGKQDVWEFELQDDWKSAIEVTVERRARRLCRCRVDVGWFGSEPTARLVMSRISGQLSHADITAPTTQARQAQR